MAPGFPCLAYKKVAARGYRQSSFWVGLALLLLAQSACVSHDAAGLRDGLQTMDLARRLGVPGCRLSDALKVDEVIRQARLDGIRIKASEEGQLTQAVRAGAKLYLVDCSVVDPKRVIVGTRFYAAVRNEKIESELLKTILD